MICLSFNLSYNIMIMYEWHQLVYHAIITGDKPTAPPYFRCISPFVWQQLLSPKCQFFGQRTTPKITRQYLSSIFNPNICSKMKSLPNTAPQCQTLVPDWTFSYRRFPPAILQPFYQTQCCVSQVASFTPKNNSG